MFSTVWHTQRFTELGREEKGEGGDRGKWVEKKESLFGDRNYVTHTKWRRQRWEREATKITQ